MTGARIGGLGMALPEDELTNADLAPFLGIDETWIEERTGIRARRVARPHETAATLGAAAAWRALESARISPREIDLVICATVTPELRFPATACLIQSALGCPAAAFDLNAGCSGFLVALSQAAAAIEAKAASRVLVVGSEVLSGIIDYKDPKTAALFGDGAGAAIVERAGSPGLGPFLLFSDGSKPDLLCVDADTGKIQMRGREVYRAAVAGMSGAVARLLAEARMTPGDVDVVIAHQANGRILTAVAARLGLDETKMFSNLARYGNTSAASIPIALAEAHDSGLLEEGDVVVVTAFGAGLVWGAGLMRWARIGSSDRELAEVAAADA